MLCFCGGITVVFFLLLFVCYIAVVEEAVDAVAVGVLCVVAGPAARFVAEVVDVDEE